MSREAAAGERWCVSRICRRFAAQSGCGDVIRGLTPTAIGWRRFATQTIRVESFEVLIGGGIKVFDGLGGGIEFGLRGVPFEQRVVRDGLVW